MAGRVWLLACQSRKSPGETCDWSEPGWLSLRSRAQMRTSRSESAYGSGDSRTPLTTENTAALAPMPRAIVAIATMANIGDRASARTAYRRSCCRVPKVSSLRGEDWGEHTRIGPSPAIPTIVAVTRSQAPCHAASPESPAKGDGCRGHPGPTVAGAGRAVAYPRQIHPRGVAPRHASATASARRRALAAARSRCAGGFRL